MSVNAPDVLQSDVHWLSILELVFKLDTLTSHLNADKNTDECRRETVYHRVRLQQTLALVATEINK